MTNLCEHFVLQFSYKSSIMYSISMHSPIYTKLNRNFEDQIFYDKSPLRKKDIYSSISNLYVSKNIVKAGSIESKIVISPKKAKVCLSSEITKSETLHTPPQKTGLQYSLNLSRFLNLKSRVCSGSLKDCVDDYEKALTLKNKYNFDDAIPLHQKSIDKKCIGFVIAHQKSDNLEIGYESFVANDNNQLFIGKHLYNHLDLKKSSDLYEFYYFICTKARLDIKARKNTKSKKYQFKQSDINNEYFQFIDDRAYKISIPVDKLREIFKIYIITEKSKNSNFKPIQEEVSTDEMTDFLNRIWVVFEQPDEEIYLTNVLQEISSWSSLLNNEFGSKVLSQCLVGLFSEKIITINEKFMENFFKSSKEVLEVLKSNLIHQGAFEFNNIAVFDEIFDMNTKMLTFFEVPFNLTSLGCLIIYRYLNERKNISITNGECVFLNVQMLKKTKLFFEKNKTQTLVIESKQKIIFDENTLEALKNLLSFNIKIIIVVPDTSNFSKYFNIKENVAFEDDLKAFKGIDIIGCSKSLIEAKVITFKPKCMVDFFTEESKNQLLEYHVFFQKAKKKLRTLFNSTEIEHEFLKLPLDNESLAKIIEGKMSLGKMEIFNPFLVEIYKKFFNDIQRVVLNVNTTPTEKEIIVLKEEKHVSSLLAWTLKSAFPDYWVLFAKLDLEAVESCHQNDFLGFLKKFLSTDLEKLLFEDFYKRNQVIVIFDEFDNILINHNYKEIREKGLIKCLGGGLCLQIQVIFVSNATFLVSKSDQNSRGEFCYNILPLNDEDRKQYLKIKMEALTNGKLENSDALIENIILEIISIKDKNRCVDPSFYLFLLSEHYSVELIRALKNNETIQIPNYFNFVESYIDAKISHVQDSKSDDFLIENNSSINYLEEYYVKISLILVLGNKVVNDLEFQFRFETLYFQNKGFAVVECDKFVNFIAGKHVFVNKIIGECLVAHRFYEILSGEWKNVNLDKFCNYLIEEVLQKDDFNIVSCFLNRFLLERSQLYNLTFPIDEVKNAFHFENDYSNFFTCLSKQINLKNFEIFLYLWSVFEKINEKEGLQINYDFEMFRFFCRCFKNFDVLMKVKPFLLKELKHDYFKSSFELFCINSGLIFDEIQNFDPNTIPFLKEVLESIGISEISIIEKIKGNYTVNRTVKYIENTLQLLPYYKIKEFFDHNTDAFPPIFFFPLLYGHAENLKCLKTIAEENGIKTDDIEYQKRIWLENVNAILRVIMLKNDLTFNWIYDEAVMSIDILKKILISANNLEAEFGFSSMYENFALLKAMSSTTSLPALEYIFDLHLTAFQDSKRSEEIKSIKNRVLEQMRHQIFLHSPIKILPNREDLMKFLLLYTKQLIKIDDIGFMRCKRLIRTLESIDVNFYNDTKNILNFAEKKEFSTLIEDIKHKLMKRISDIKSGVLEDKEKYPKIKKNIFDLSDSSASDTDTSSDGDLVEGVN